MTASTTGSGPVGETTVNSTVHPVVTIAVPAENASMPSPAAEMQDTSITSMSGETHTAPTLDERLKISHRTGVYTQPDTITIRTNQTRYSEFGQVNATGPVDGLEYRSWHTRPAVRQLDIEVEIGNRNRSAETATVGIQLFDQATATPVSASELPGHVTAVGRRLDMDHTTTLNISTAGTESLTVTYYPGATFESELMYLKTSTTVRTTAAIPRANSVIGDLLPLAIILVLLWLPYKLIRLALPPGMRSS
jgi:hypothetical protein